ncbi:hypothetical protein SAMN04489735_10752 [Aneurinibacillus thermoaerophilus]|uniref:Uncharacterized protein n=2 Tax=Aneurinibacillus thermoaerophilus TaxID=143495 RepID=A0A1G8FNL8_ANETH|nr:XRE family transcriptional regulator [Aneurinibacillus thermoaerophilus]SDH83606.1 hypothetical protein SAMN04489735_10752 [Aneurinibacillus thermoaerophilus]
MNVATKQGQKGDENMSIADKIGQYLEEKNIPAGVLAEQLGYEKSTVIKIKNGKRRWQEENDPSLAAVDWRFAVAIAAERSGGYISNLLDLDPDIDIHPAAMKEVVLKELHDLERVLEATIVSKKDSPKRKLEGKRLWKELKDVLDKGAVKLGVIEEVYGLDRKELLAEYEEEVRRGER